MTDGPGFNLGLMKKVQGTCAGVTTQAVACRKPHRRTSDGKKSQHDLSTCPSFFKIGQLSQPAQKFRRWPDLFACRDEHDDLLLRVRTLTSPSGEDSKFHSAAVASRVDMRR